MSNDLFHDEFQLDTKLAEKSTPQKGTRDLATYPEPIRAEVTFRLAYLNWIMKHLEGKWTQSNLEPLIVKAAVEFDGKTPSWRTVRRWWDAYSTSNFSFESLIPKVHRRGNRKPKTASENECFIHDAIKRYLVEERPSIAAAYEIFKDTVVLNNKYNQLQIKPMSYKGFYGRIKKIPTYDRTLARYGKARANKEYRAVYGHKPVNRVMQKVEIDHTPLDLILLDDELNVPLGRPYLTMLIDKYSRCVVGLYFGFKEPSYLSVKKALLNTIKDKQTILERFPSITNEWPCSGKMESLVVDNGAEFWSENLECACRELNIQVDYNSVGKPWLKPFVERFFGTINRKFLVTIPGKSFSNIFEKDNYNPVKDAVMHFSVFNELFHKWIVDVYHQDKDARGIKVPIVLWREGCDKIPPLTISESDLTQAKIVLGNQDLCTHREGGIHLHSLRYDSEALAAYRKEFLDKDNPKLIVKTDPEDISFVHVYLPKRDYYLKVDCIDPTGYTKNLSLYEHKVIQKLNRDYVDNQIDKESLAEARFYINQRISQEVQSIIDGTKKSRRAIRGMSKLAKFQDVNSENVGTVVSPEQVKAETIAVDERAANNDDWLDEWDDLVPDLDD